LRRRGDGLTFRPRNVRTEPDIDYRFKRERRMGMTRANGTKWLLTLGLVLPVALAGACGTTTGDDGGDATAGQGGAGGSGGTGGQAGGVGGGGGAGATSYKYIVVYDKET